MKPLFEVHQKITFLANEYRILKDGKSGQELVGYAKQKRLALREQFTLFANESQTEVAATSKARSVMDFGPTFDIYAERGKPLAVFKKEFKKSLLISTWSIYDYKMEKLLFKVYEKSTPIAILRRLWELIPWVQDFVPFPIRFHFSISSGDKVVGEYEKITTFRDHYVLKLEENHSKRLDVRAWMVMAVLLDAMQSR